MLAQRLGRFADLALARKEHQHVAPAGDGTLVDSVDERIHQRAVIRIVDVGDRPVAHLDRVQPSRDLDHRSGRVRRSEVPRESLGIDRRRSDDHFQIGPARQQLPEVAEQKVDVERTLVRLVDDQRVVLREQRVGLRLGEQDAVRHQLDRSAPPRLVVEAHLEADHVAERRAQLLRDPSRNARSGNAARLRVTNDARLAASQRQADLGQLRGLPRARLAADDDDLVRADGASDVLAPGRNRQFLGKGDGRQRRANPRPRLAGRVWRSRTYLSVLDGSRCQEKRSDARRPAKDSSRAYGLAGQRRSRPLILATLRGGVAWGAWRRCGSDPRISNGPLAAPSPAPHAAPRDQRGY